MKTILEEFRKSINKIDKEIDQLLEERLKIVTQIAEYKKQNNIAIIDKKREAEILAKIDSPFKKEIFKKILAESRKAQSCKNSRKMI